MSGLIADSSEIRRSLRLMARSRPRHPGGGGMTDLVPADGIEQIVGARRHSVQHLARAVSAEQTVYILHSHKCLDSGIDLRDCPYSLALDRGINPADWAGYEDRPVVVAVIKGRLFPVVPNWPDTPEGENGSPDGGGTVAQEGEKP